MKKIIAVILSLVLALSLAACSGSSENVIKVGATPAPHAEILEQVKQALADQGYTLQIVEYGDYVLPNDALENGELDANYFQHITYMNGFNAEHGTHLVSIAAIHYEPFGIYAGKTASLDALADGAVIGVPNDATNEARALLLLEQEGLIKLKEGVGIDATKEDILENPHNYDIKELDADKLTAALPDVDIAVINGNFAIDAGLKISQALAVEASDGAAAEAYANIIAVKEGNENDPKVLALVEALKSAAVKSYIEENYSGAVVPLT